MVSGRNVYIFQPNSSLRSQLKSRLWRNPTWTETLRLNRAGPLQRTPGTTAAAQQGKEAEPPLCWSNNNGISQFRINLNIFRKPIFFLNLMNLFKIIKYHFRASRSESPDSEVIEESIRTYLAELLKGLGPIKYDDPKFWDQIGDTSVSLIGGKNRIRNDKKILLFSVIKLLVFKAIFLF